LDIESGDSGTRVFAIIPVPKAATPEDESTTEPLQASEVL
jgi:hypothetical protein